MADGSRYKRRSAAQWRELIAEQARSGMGQAAFCAAHGLALSTLQLWQRRLRGKASSKLAVATSERLFTPLAVSRAAMPDESSGGWRVELDLGEGMRLRLWREP